MKFIALAAFAAFAAAAVPAAAVVQLDQNAMVATPGEGRVFQVSSTVRNGASGFDLMQTFTAGLTGTLARIDTQNYVLSGPPATFTLTVYSGNATGAGATALGSVNVASLQSAASIGAGAMNQIDVSSLGIAVTAGSLYSYEFAAAHTPAVPATTLGWVIGTADADFGNAVLNDYAGGRSYRETYTGGVSNGWDTSGNFAVDRGFQTYVDVAPVPEPGEWAMMIAGLGVVGFAARRRRKG